MVKLTANIDPLRADPLRADPLAQGDPLSAQSSLIIPEYNKELGFALMPGQEGAINKFHQGILGSVSKQQSALDLYKKRYEENMSIADKKIGGFLGKLGHPAGQQDTVDVWIMGRNGVETKHRVNRAWADKNMPQLHDKSHGLYNPMYNDAGKGHYEIYAAGYGKELRSMLTSAAKQTTQADEQIGAGNRAFDKQKSALEYKFNEQRQSATDRYNFEVNRANAIIQQTSAQWTNYVSSMRRKFKQGIQTNNSGIADLLKSGALVLT